MLREVYAQKLSALIGYLTGGTALLCHSQYRIGIKLDADIIDIIIYVFFWFMGKLSVHRHVLFFHPNQPTNSTDVSVGLIAQWGVIITQWLK
jgi:hypothetical protein